MGLWNILKTHPSNTFSEKILLRNAPATDAQRSEKLSKRLALRLAVAMALGGGNASVIFATGAILGAMLAPDAGMATLPITIFVIGMAFGTLPIGAASQRFGRRAALLTGAGCGALCGFLCATACYRASFALYCCGTFFGGVYACATQSYRFAVADGASPALAPRLMSWVMAGGVAAAFIGPQLVEHTASLWPQYAFAATYLGQACVALAAMCILWGVNAPTKGAPPQSNESTEGKKESRERPLREIAISPPFIVAASCGVASYALMNLLMTSAPLAMKLCGLSLSDSTLGIQWHVLAMYAPGFFTGSLISRLGASKIAAMGLFLEIAAALVNFAGLSVEYFWSGLILLGLGWNFGFLGASAMILAGGSSKERAKIQSFNDFLIFGVMALGSFSSGQLLTRGGWGAVNGVVLPIAGLALLLLAFHSKGGREIG